MNRRSVLKSIFCFFLGLLGWPLKVARSEVQVYLPDEFKHKPPEIVLLDIYRYTGHGHERCSRPFDPCQPLSNAAWMLFLEDRRPHEPLEPLIERGVAITSFEPISMNEVKPGDVCVSYSPSDKHKPLAERHEFEIWQVSERGYIGKPDGVDACGIERRHPLQKLTVQERIKLLDEVYGIKA